MTTRRDAILRGVERAAALHQKLGLREQLKAGDRPVDVLRAIQDLGLLILFRPLDGLLGAYLPSAVSPGVIVTTNRPLHVQRFTAAHELGHHVLQHRAVSLDRPEDVGFVARGDVGGHDFQEVEADAFASEFLLPKWLIVALARRHQWGAAELAKPDIAYQLSLRLATSYAATCWALAENGIIERERARRLVDVPPKDAKQRALPDVIPESWHLDVWTLTEQDRGTRVLGNPDDRLVLALHEHIANGYTWDSAAVEHAGLTVERDDRKDGADEYVGAPVTRRLVVRGPGSGTLRLEERRLWDPPQSALNTYELALELLGAESEGLPRAARALAA